MKKLFLLLSLAVLTLCLSTAAFASTDLKGMGDAPGPAATGDNGIDWNPAAMNAGNKTVILDLNILNTNVWTNALNFYEIAYYGGLVEGTDSVWTDQEIDEILSRIPSEGFGISASHDSRVKLILGPVGLSVGANAQASGRIDKDIFTILLKGNSDYVDVTGETDELIDFTDTRASVLATGDAALTLSLPLHSFKTIKQSTGLDELYVGGTFHLLVGGFAEACLTDNTKFSIGYDEETGLANIKFEDQQSIQEKMKSLPAGTLYPLIRGTFPYDPSQVGMGTATDLGVYGRKGKMSFGLSLMNLGSITIPGGKILEFGLIAAPDTDLGFTVTPSPVESDSSEPMTKVLPWRLNTGASYRFGRALNVGTVFSIIKSPDNLTYSSLGAGLEFNPIGLLPLRAGINYSSGKHSFTYSVGTGLHLGPLKTDLAAAMDLKGVSLGLNTSLEF